jgi:hypothetical protein
VTACGQESSRRRCGTTAKYFSRAATGFTPPGTGTSGRSLWDLWSSKWHWDRFLTDPFGLFFVIINPQLLYFHSCTICGWEKKPVRGPFLQIHSLTPPQQQERGGGGGAASEREMLKCILRYKDEERTGNICLRMETGGRPL